MTVMSRYEFLARAHAIWRPRVYLEIGVQSGASLALAEAADLAIGVDPDLSHFAREHRRPNQDTVAWTSREFFQRGAPAVPACSRCDECDGHTAHVGRSHARYVDFAYIDGSHLFEDVLTDFIAVEQYCGPASVVMLDDVLPYNQAIAARVQPPGDWTGDAWKIFPVLDELRPDLLPVLVDVAPTGLLIVLDLDATGPALIEAYDKIMETWRDVEYVPLDIIERAKAISANAALDLLETRRATHG